MALSITDLLANPTAREVARCKLSFLHFVETYCRIYDANERDWLPFALWPQQKTVADTLLHKRLIVILKARQLGMTWLCLAYILWQMMYKPGATILIFCRGDREAVYLLGDERLRGMWNLLPPEIKTGYTVVENSDHTWALSNGSIARALPATAGDSFTVTYCLVDEADICPDLNGLMRRAKPTIDGGGKMTLLSRVDKSTPQSEFKNIYRGAIRGENDYAPIFLPWTARPERDAAWYEAQRKDVLTRTGALDDLWEQYPETGEQALRPAQKDKRLAAEWFEHCAREIPPLEGKPGDPAVPGLRVYQRPVNGHSYVIGADPGEGNPGSDPSAMCVMDVQTGEEVAAFNVPVQLTTFANYVDIVGAWYWRAALMVERNNHGHAILMWLTQNSHCAVLNGHDGKPGWLSSSLGKTLLYNTTADAVRNAEVLLHDMDTISQLQSVEGATLLAPKGEHDDAADACALACCGRPLTTWSFADIGGSGKRKTSVWRPPR